MDVDQKKKMNKAMAEANATGGAIAVNALKAEFLGMPPLTRELQLYHATQSENATLIKGLLDEALNKSVTMAQFDAGRGERMADMMDAAIKSANEFDTVLAAGGAGMDGVAGDLSAQFGVSAKVIAKYMDGSGSDIKFARDKFMEDFTAGLIPVPDDGELGAMASFLVAMGEAKKALTNNFINPIVKTLTPALGKFTDWFTAFVGTEGESTKFQNALAGFSKYLDEKVNPALEKFFLNVDENGLGAALNEALFGSEDGESKGLLDTIFKPMGVALANGIKDGFKAIFSDPVVIAGTVAAIGLLFAGPVLAGAIAGRIAAGALAAAGTTALGAKALKSPPGATVGRDPKTGKFTSLKPDPNGGMLKKAGKLGMRGLKFIPGIGLIAAGAMGIFDGAQGFSADPDAGVGESLGNAGSSILNGLTFGLFGSSPDEIAANAGTKPAATTKDKDIAETLGVTPDTVKLLERMSGIGGGMERVASAFERIDKLERFSTNVNAIQKGLDINELSKYNRNMQEIAKSLEDMNKALAEDNKGLFGGTGVASADLLKKMGGSGPSAELIESINSNMRDMKSRLDDVVTNTKKTAKNTE